MFAKRGSAYYVGLISYWDAGCTTIASSSTALDVSHAANSHEVVVTNNISTGAIGCMLIGIAASVS